jgi:hypothetical protein
VPDHSTLLPGEPLIFVEVALTTGYLNEVYRIAPRLPELSRNRQSLYDQFIYRFDHSPEHRVMYGVVEFGAQWVFQLMAIPREMVEMLIPREEAAAGMLDFRHECFLVANSSVCSGS